MTTDTEGLRLTEDQELLKDIAYVCQSLQIDIRHNLGEEGWLSQVRELHRLTARALGMEGMTVEQA